jgi:hypothetical protein
MDLFQTVHTWVEHHRVAPYNRSRRCLDCAGLMSQLGSVEHAYGRYDSWVAQKGQHQEPRSDYEPENKVNMPEQASLPEAACMLDDFETSLLGNVGKCWDVWRREHLRRMWRPPCFHTLRRKD